MRHVKFSKLALAAVAGAIAGHFLEAPVKALAVKVWGKLHPDHPDHAPPAGNDAADNDEG